MAIIRNGKKYYTMEEMLKKWEEHIRENAEELITELKKKRLKKFKSGTEIVFSNNGKICTK